MKNFSLNFARAHFPESPAIIQLRRDWSFNSTTALCSRALNTCTKPLLRLRWRVARNLNGEFAKANAKGASVIGAHQNKNRKQNMKTTKTTKPSKENKVIKLTKAARREAALKAWKTIRANRKAAASKVKAKAEPKIELKKAA